MTRHHTRSALSASLAGLLMLISLLAVSGCATSLGDGGAPLSSVAQNTVAPEPAGAGVTVAQMQAQPGIGGTGKQDGKSPGIGGTGQIAGAAPGIGGTGPAARRRAAKKMSASEIEVAIDLGVGRASAQMWTCDLSYDYVKINAEYTT